MPKASPQVVKQIYPKPNYCPGTGPSNAKIAIVGEAPGAEEDKSGIPFSGAAGRLLTSLLSDSGIERGSCYITNVVKYRPPLNDFKRLGEIGVSYEESLLQLKHEINTLNPNIILALGNQPLLALTGKRGITKYRGSILITNFGHYKVIPTYHPAALLRQEGFNKDDQTRETLIGGETIVRADLMKLKRESETPDFTAKPKRLEIIKTEYELYKFLESYSNCKEVSIDIEASTCFPSCIALAFTPYHSVSIPLIPICGVGNGITLTDTEYRSIWKTLSEFLNRKDIKFIGQNFKYDHEKLIAPAKLVGYGHEKLAADTSLMMGIAYTEFPKNLAFMTSLFTNEPYYKDEGREFNPKKDKAEQLLIYNAKDAAVTFECKKALDKELEDFGNIYHRDLKGFYYNYVNKLHDFYMDIELEGLDVDQERRKELINSYDRDISERHKSLEELIGHEFNVRSNPSVRKLLADELGLPPRPNYQEDTIVSLLGNHTQRDSREAKILTLILEERQLRTNANYLKAEPDPDGRMRTSYRITGTETGRTSSSILKAPLRPIQSGLALQIIPKHGPFAKAIRSIFIPPPGYVFLEADLSQADARIVAILADDEYTLQLFNTTDIHSVTASWIFNCEPGSVTSDQRFIGKTIRHAGNYGMGKRKLMLEVNSQAKKYGINVQISESEAEKLLQIFHSRTPKIRRVFQTQVKAEVAKCRTLFNPFGRMRQFFGNLKDEECLAQIPQSTVSDSLRLAGLRLKKLYPSLRICVEAHDAFLFKVPENEAEKWGRIIKQELEAEIDFRNCSLPRGKLIIPAEVKVGNRYSELEKVKL